MDFPPGSATSLGDQRYIPNLNDENKTLQAEVHGIERHVARLDTDFNRALERVGVMSEHLKNVTQELQHTKSLSDARKREHETDIHMKTLVDQEAQRLEKEMKRLNGEMADIRKLMDQHQNDLFRGSRKAADLKSQMSLHQQAMTKWMADAQQREADAFVLQKYAAADDAHLKDLRLRMERAEEESVKKRQMMEKEVTECLATQVALDKTAEQFRSAQVEREEMISQWETTLQQMSRRDKQIDDVSLRLAAKKAEISDRSQELKEKQWFLEQEQENNKEEDKHIHWHEKMVARTRFDMQRAETSRQQMADELETLKFTVDRVASDERTTRAEVLRLRKDLADKKLKLADIQDACDQSRQQLEHSTIETLVSEDFAQKFEIMIAEKEEMLRQLQKELDKQQGIKFKRSQELFELRGDKENVKAELQGAKFAYRNLRSKLRKFDGETRKQEDLLYMQNFTLQHLEGRAARLEGERTNDEKIQLNNQITELTERWEEQKSVQTMLTNELRKINDDVRRITSTFDKAAVEQEALQGKIEELELHNTNSLRELKRTSDGKQELQVETNILKLTLKGRRKAMNARVDQVMGLESRQTDLKTAMAERRQEIKSHKELLDTQLKALSGEKSRFSAELMERQSRIDKLRKRYEIMAMTMCGPDGEEEHSQVYYVIKAAQEKEELQRLGDELEAKVRKGEKEIIAMENTLKLLSRSNRAFRTSLNPVQADSEEALEEEALVGTLDAAASKFKLKRKQLRGMQEDVKRLQDTASEVVRKEAALLEEIGRHQKMLETAKKEKGEQHEKKDRAQRMVTKAKKEAKQKYKDEWDDLQRDVAAREIRDFNLSMMQALGNISQDEPELMESVYTLCSQLELPRPPAPVASGGSRGSSLAGSRQSSVASDRSSRASSLGSSRSVSSVGRVTQLSFGGAEARTSSCSVGKGSTGSLRKPPRSTSGASTSSTSRTSSRKQ